MLKSNRHEFLRSTRQLKAACDNLNCAVKDNPHAFNGLDYEEPQRYEPRRERQVRYAHISIVGLSIAWIIKAIGLH